MENQKYVYVINMAKIDYNKEICIELTADEMTEVAMFRMVHDDLKLKQKTDDYRDGYTLCGTLDDMLNLHSNIKGITEIGSYSYDIMKEAVKKLRTGINEEGIDIR